VAKRTIKLRPWYSDGLDRKTTDGWQAEYVGKDQSGFNLYKIIGPDGTWIQTSRLPGEVTLDS